MIPSNAHLRPGAKVHGVSIHGREITGRISAQYVGADSHHYSTVTTASGYAEDCVTGYLASAVAPSADAQGDLARAADLIRAAALALGEQHMGPDALAGVAAALNGTLLMAAEVAGGVALRLHGARGATHMSHVAADAQVAAAGAAEAAGAIQP